tara:strand:+ start:2546 stop:2827 length:282 start_codon:yes stop_codon:yes gene_type:complete
LDYKYTLKYGKVKKMMNAEDILGPHSYEITHQDDMERLLVDAIQALNRFAKEAEQEKHRPGNVTLLKDVERALKTIREGQERESITLGMILDA